MNKGVKKTLTKDLNFKKVKKNLTVNEELKIQLKTSFVSHRCEKQEFFCLTDHI